MRTDSVKMTALRWPPLATIWSRTPGKRFDQGDALRVLSDAQRKRAIAFKFGDLGFEFLRIDRRLGRIGLLVFGGQFLGRFVDHIIVPERTRRRSAEVP